MNSNNSNVDGSFKEKESMLHMDKLSPAGGGVDTGNRLSSAAGCDTREKDAYGRPSPEEETGMLDVGYDRHQEEEEDDDEDEFDDDDDNGLMMLDATDAIAIGIRDLGLPGPPDGGWGYVILLAAFVINMIMDGVTSSFSVLLPQIVETYRSVRDRKSVV